MEKTATNENLNENLNANEKINNEDKRNKKSFNNKPNKPYEVLRLEITKEINEDNIKPISFEIYRKTEDEKTRLKNAIQSYKLALSKEKKKQSKNRILFNYKIYF